MARTTVYNHITTEEKIAEINENNTWLMNEFLEYLASVDRSLKTLNAYRNDYIYSLCGILILTIIKIL